MDFPTRLAAALEATKESEIPSRRGILKWNEEVETFLAAPPTNFRSSEDTKEETLEAIICAVANELHTGIVATAIRHQEPASSLEDQTRIARGQYDKHPLDQCPEKLFDFIRVSKNLLRWHIQVFLDHKGSIILPSPVRTLQSPHLIDLLVVILERCTLKTDSIDQALARNVALYLFYATYIAFPGDETSQQALQHLMLNMSFPKLTLQILMSDCSFALALSLVRNLHNAIVTSQEAAKNILATKITWDPTGIEAAAKWAPKEKTRLDFQSICVNLLLWAISSDPPFPGVKDDKRGELAIEILGVFYAIRLGQELDPGSCDEDMMKLVVDILKLSYSKDKRIDQCKLSVLSLLMDSDPSFGEYLMQEDAFTSLLDILETQVTDVLEKLRVDNSATASLVPILMTLNKYAGGSSEICHQVKLFIFPADAEVHFQDMARGQRLSSESKNMGPLDAPEGSLRRKLTSLLTWPEGHIKRCTGELLWILCSSNPTEYVHRVGFGNALPILSVKGFAKMPVQS